MSRTVNDIASRLTDEIPKLDLIPALRIVNDAGRNIYDAHQWSFLFKEGILFAPDAISTGTFSVVQFSATVQASAAAITALSAVSNPFITKRQIRFGGGPLYNIAAYDNVTGILTLDRIYRELTNTATVYMIYRCYFSYPEDGTGAEVTDFKSFHSIYNPTIPNAFVDFSVPSNWLNFNDPQRTNVGSQTPNILVQYKTTAGATYWELWPHITNQTALIVNYQSRWAGDWALTDVVPDVIAEELLLERSLYHSYRWAEAHKGMYPELRGINWIALMHGIDDGAVDNPQGTYYRKLENAKNKDREKFNDMLVLNQSNLENLQVGDAQRTGYFQIDYTVSP